MKNSFDIICNFIEKMEILELEFNLSTDTADSTKVSRLCSWLKTYPGDGVLLFHDSLLGPVINFTDSEIRSFNPPDEYIKLFQYLYSFQNGFSPLAKTVLALTDIRLRGLEHHNCLGAYVDRHFWVMKLIPANYKTLLLFTDFYEAEIKIKYDEIRDKVCFITPLFCRLM